MTARRKPKVGGARPGAGRKSRTGVAASVPRTVKLTPGEAAAQDAVAGETPWATWARETLTAAAPPPSEE